ncbi:hypothetical protein J2S40_003396 [Nocardioides luteus]|uniref:SHOCT domain-containing protein n=1 Tax=Nocardioides luteus TaxID=1844 RepID=A0ABQ5SY47_9ACTN|nr:SHOCT domain-containing protein [Nocardioides luteus]MDR7312338.1 hypothetical protein [Nocardioides luteus]GGR57812.1 hypothetical protein GCM10010197_25610 [Nocardioides luteus]GLJ68583.1 hypothetical protein GCM10017579_26190 [Nocardioides luteus]
MSQLDDRRFYPVSPDVAYAALVEAVRDVRFTLKAKDDFGKAVRVGTPMSGFSWGATLSLSVTPEPSGSSIQVSGGANMKANLTARGPEAKNVTRLLAAVSARVQKYVESGGTVEANDAAGPRRSSLPDELARLGDLKARGLITNSEFQTAKAKLLAD